MRWRISRRGGRTLFSDHDNLARDRIDLSYRRRRALRSVTTFERALECCCRRTSISGWLLDLAKTPLKSLMFGRIKVHVHVLWSRHGRRCNELERTRFHQRNPRNSHLSSRAVAHTAQQCCGSTPKGLPTESALLMPIRAKVSALSKTNWAAVLICTCGPFYVRLKFDQ